MARSDPQINLRIPAGLKERIEAAAASNKRSMNAEIAERLEESFRDPPDERIVLSADPDTLQEAMLFAVGKVFERADWPEKFAEAMSTRKKKEGE